MAKPPHTDGGREHLNRFWGGWNYPHAGGTRPSIFKKRCLPTLSRGTLTHPSKPVRMCPTNPVGLWECTKTRLEKFSERPHGLGGGVAQPPSCRAPHERGCTHWVWSDRTR